MIEYRGSLSRQSQFTPPVVALDGRKLTLWSSRRAVLVNMMPREDWLLHSRFAWTPAKLVNGSTVSDQRADPSASWAWPSEVTASSAPIAKEPARPVTLAAPMIGVRVGETT